MRHLRFRNYSAGFTRGQVLVIAAVIIGLGGVTSMTLSSARENTRDLTRLRDIQTVRDSLSKYFDDQQSFPPTDRTGKRSRIDLGAGADCDGGTAACRCLGTVGFVSMCGAGQAYLEQLPVNPQPGGTTYTYAAMTSGGQPCWEVGQVCDRYELRFTLESPNPDLGKGVHCVANALQVTCQ